ncbi:WD40 repeat-like protein [Gonapodya prolifera JEL478]|uniref:WD40 repeat-like protein n=1 Tax=Gonapodya prolifera (strain JEL478) TaxID=1344416 RepID=A0A139AX74_GONPJ|nr:WD40 repeat-like protein [Gonapodya prolifera JEL478]|eukprot:KXS21320.1 WD40 repeat-like protein [Gonapodya prolifera JEL478]
MEKSGIYGIPNHTARCLAPVAAEQERNRFLVGTTDRTDNEIHLLDFEEDDFEISSLVYRHPRDVWAITPSPTRVDMLFTAYTKVDDGAISMGASLWKMPSTEIDDQNKFRPKPNLQLEEVLKLDSGSAQPSRIAGILCDPGSTTTDTVVTLEDRCLQIWNIDLGSSSVRALRSLDANPHPTPDIPSYLTAGAWNPHAAEQIVSACGGEVAGWDLRIDRQAFHIGGAHSDTIRSIDCNPNRPHILVTASDDRSVRFWDVRNADAPIKEVSGHSHWIWAVAFNKSHDQLVLTSSSDCQVNLHNIISISSAPFGESEESSDDDGADRGTDSGVKKGEHASTEKGERDTSKKTKKPGDSLAATYDQHEESVYSVAWSPADPWIFGSLSHDGRVVVNLVPQTLKYQILL